MSRSTHLASLSHQSACAVAIIPVRAVLEAGPNGSFAFLLNAVTANDGRPQEAAYFWLTGALSAFLDNAPTYLVFFELAGGDAKQLMGPLAGTLASISMGAVYMGAADLHRQRTFMVYAIAQDRGIRMPDFFSYMLWVAAILVPIFLLLTALPTRPAEAHSARAARPANSRRILPSPTPSDV